MAEAFALPELDQEIKRHRKSARQNGIHVSPTFMIDGLVQPDMSSGDAVSDWVTRLRLSSDRPSCANNSTSIAGRQRTGLTGIPKNP